jgi:hypothetical protein
MLPTLLLAISLAAFITELSGPMVSTSFVIISPTVGLFLIALNCFLFSSSYKSVLLAPDMKLALRTYAIILLFNTAARQSD